MPIKMLKAERAILHVPVAKKDLKAKDYDVISGVQKPCRNFCELEENEGERNKMGNIKQDQKIKGFIPKQNIYSLIIFVMFMLITIFMLFLFVKHSFARGLTEFGMTYNTSNKIEKINLTVNYANKKNNLEMEFKNRLSKEQIADKLITLNVNSLTQINFYPNIHFYTFAGAKYNRNLEMGILDKTDFNIGIGYKNSKPKRKYFIQGGISARNTFCANETEKSIYFIPSGEIRIPFLLLFELKDSIEININLKKLYDEDYEVYNDVYLIFSAFKPLHFITGLEYSYIHRPPQSFPQDQKIWVARIGLEF